MACAASSADGAKGACAGAWALAVPAPAAIAKPAITLDPAQTIHFVIVSTPIVCRPLALERSRKGAPASRGKRSAVLPEATDDAAATEWHTAAQGAKIRAAGEAQHGQLLARRQLAMGPRRRAGNGFNRGCCRRRCRDRRRGGSRGL